MVHTEEEWENDISGGDLKVLYSSRFQVPDT